MKKDSQAAYQWIVKGNHDLDAANILYKNNGPFDTIVFHCQQAVEKYLKSFIAYNNQKIPYTHDLYHLSKICSNIDSDIHFNMDYLVELSTHAVETRYDLNEEIKEDSVIEALEYTIKVRDIIQSKIE